MNSEIRYQCGRPQRPACRLMMGVKLILLMLLPTMSHALEFQCELNDDVRQLSVLIPGDQHLCEVSVDYESTGNHRVMWHAENDSLFCSAKAYELVGKYKNEWGFSCTKWPDRDGVDELSPTQRSILDLQLKKRLVAGESTGSSTQDSARVITVKATASTLLDHEPGTLAIQYFFSDGSDQTEIIDFSDTSWTVFATIDDMASQITGSEPIDTALVSTITDGGALEIVTTMASSDGKPDCYGKQVLMSDANSQLKPRTPHRIICDASASLSPQSD